MTQQEMVLKHLKEQRTITPLEALREYGCYRLAAVVFNLKRKGHEIVSTTEESIGRFGNKVRFAKYTLIKSL